MHHAFDQSSAGIALPANGFDAFDHPVRHGGIGTTHDVCFHVVSADAVNVDAGLQVVNALHPGNHLGAVCLEQHLSGDGPSRDAPNRFAR